MDGFKSFEVVYGAENLVESDKWFISSFDPGVRLITVAPEVPGVMKAIQELVEKGIAVSIGHRCGFLPEIAVMLNRYPLQRCKHEVCNGRHTTRRQAHYSPLQCYASAASS
jgi:hypothetical protein